MAAILKDLAFAASPRRSTVHILNTCLLQQRISPAFRAQLPANVCTGKSWTQWWSQRQCWRFVTCGTAPAPSPVWPCHCSAVQHCKEMITQHIAKQMCAFFQLSVRQVQKITLLWAWCKPWSYSGHSSCEIYHHNRYRHCGAHGILPMRDLWSRKCSRFEHSTANSENGRERSQNGNLQKWLELKLRPHDNHAVVALDAHQRQAMNWNHQVSLVEYQHLNKTHWLARWESLLVLPVSEDQVRMARQLVASHGGPSACKTQRSPHEEIPANFQKRKKIQYYYLHVYYIILPFFLNYISIFVQNIPIYIVWCAWCKCL